MITVRQVRKRQEIEQIKQALQPLNIDYATPQHAETDFINKNNKIYALVDNNNIVAVCSIVPDTTYNYLALKRLVVLNPTQKGKGYAKRLVSTVVKRQNSACGCTPWADNTPMINLLKAIGFKYQYTFCGFWTFWKSA